MTSPFSFVLSLKELFAGKLQQFVSDIDDVHCVWLSEIKQEADRMLTSDFSAEPELMPKTPSQKRNNRRKRVSLGYQETRAKRRFSKGKRSKLRGSSVKTLDLLAEDEGIPRASTSGQVVEQPKRSTRRNKLTQPEASLEEAAFSDCSAEQVPEVGPEVAEQVPEVGPEVAEQVPEVGPEVAEQVPEVGPEVADEEKSEVIDMEFETVVPDAETEIEEETEIEADEPQVCSSIPTPSPPEIPAPTVSLRLSLKLRYSKAGLRHSRMQDAVHRTSRRSILKKKLTRGGNTTCSSNDSDDSCIEIDGEVEKDRELPSVQSDEAETAADEPQAIPDKAGSGNERVTRSMAVNSPVLLFSPVLSSMLRGVPSVLSPGGAKTTPVGSWRGSRNSKRKSPEAKEATPNKKPLPAKKSQSVMRPNMRAFLQTVQKNQMLMMTPASMGRSTVMKSFIKHTTPLKVDAKDVKHGLVAKERLKLEALKKKQEQEEERIKKMEEEKRRKLDEQKRKRDERLRRVVEARMKEDEEKKKRIEQKMSQTDEKNDKMRVERVAEAKKKVAVKRQEELEQKRLEEEARLKKIQQAEDEKRQQELVAKRAEEEERARKLAEARRALELRREREKEQEQEKERRALAERERAEREKALATLWANREKERKEMEEKRNLEEKRRREEHQRLAAEDAAREAAMHKMAALNAKSSLLNSPVRKGAALNITVEVEKSPQSYSLTPKGGNKPLLKSNSAEDYGMDQKSDDSYFGVCEPPKLEDIFYKSKPRYFKRTSSAVWQSPPRHGHH
ncbi:unnamed protein product [Boreogadus saida]